ncbi:MAG: TlpA family protein disulfide reductase [Dehalococcoidia bacterium]
MATEPQSDILDERPQRRREWSGPLRSVALPVLVVAAIVAAVWYLEAGRSSGASSVGAGKGQGIIALDPARNKTGKPASAETGRAAPDFQLKTLDGKSVRLSDLQGKTVLINFWATWCTPCRQEMPEIVQAYSKYHDKGFEVVSVDEQEDPDTVKKWVDAFGMQFPVALDTSGQVGQTFRAGTQFPTSLWLNPSGVVTDVKYGPMSQAFLDQRLGGLQ